MSAPEDEFDVAALFARIPYAGFLGITGKPQDGALLMRMAFSDHLIGNPTIPALHGGTIGAFMELTAIAELARKHEGRLSKTIGVTVEYLRSGRARDTFARAEVKRMGRRIANVRVEAWQEDPAKPIAALYGNYMLPHAAEPDPTEAEA